MIELASQTKFASLSLHKVLQQMMCEKIIEYFKSTNSYTNIYIEGSQFQIQCNWILLKALNNTTILHGMLYKT